MSEFIQDVRRPARRRAFEVDVLRGICIWLTICHHFMYDVRYIFNYDACRFFESRFFQGVVHPLLLIGLFIASGLSINFSKNNFKRAKKLALIALGLTSFSVIFSVASGGQYYIIWQILHSLATCIALAAFVKFKVKSIKIQQLIYLALALTMTFVLPVFIRYYHLDQLAPSWLLPLGMGYRRPEIPIMLDYIPLIPLGGFFFLGAALAHVFYPEGKVERRFFQSNFWLPLRFTGEYSLYFYAIHQPILIFLIWLYGKIAL